MICVSYGCDLTSVAYSDHSECKQCCLCAHILQDSRIKHSVFFIKKAARNCGQPFGVTSRCLFFCSSQLCSNFCSEINFATINTFAHFKTYKRNDGCAGLLRQLTNGDFWVLNECLLNQACFSQELLDTTGNHVFNNVVWLAFDLIFVQRQENFFFFSNCFIRNLSWIEELRAACSNVHRNVFGQFCIATAQRNDNTNAVTVQVSTNHVAFNAS